MDSHIAPGDRFFGHPHSTIIETGHALAILAGQLGYPVRRQQVQQNF